MGFFVSFVEIFFNFKSVQYSPCFGAEFAILIKKAFLSPDHFENSRQKLMQTHLLFLFIYFKYRTVVFHCSHGPGTAIIVQLWQIDQRKK